jgi:hypothetical protein
MNSQQYQLIESHLLVVMLRNRKVYNSAVHRFTDSGEKVPSEPALSADNGHRRDDFQRTAEIEADYKQALRRFHDFVLAKTTPDGFPSIRSEVPCVLDDSEASALSTAQLSLDRRTSPADRRAEQRVKANLSPAKLRDAEGNRVPAVILDVSSSGLGIAINIAMPINTPVIIELNDGYRVFGKVKYCKARSPSGSYSVGIRISKIRTAGGRDI